MFINTRIKNKKNTLEFKTYFLSNKPNIHFVLNKQYFDINKYLGTNS